MIDMSVYSKLQDEWGLLTSKDSSGEMANLDWSFIHDQERVPRATILFAELEDTRELWRELLGMVELESYSDRFITPAWTIKDMVAHITSWASELRYQAETAAQGQTFDYAIPYALSIIGPNEWNQREVEKRRNLSLGDVLQELDVQSANLEDLVLDLPEADLQTERQFAMAPNGDPSTRWKGTISQIILLKCSHERYHLDRIRQWHAAIRRTGPLSLPARRPRIKKNK
jgi:hypothetical protein